MKAIILVLTLLLITSVNAIELSCQDAIQAGNLSATITGNTVLIHNPTGYQVSVASYEMYAALTEDQVLYESKTITNSSTITIDTPSCNHQIAIVCGEPLPYNPLYNDLVIAHNFNLEEQYCIPAIRENNVSVDIEIKENYPKSTSYVFECNADGFTPTSYYWYYGDGEILPQSKHNNTYHTYAQGGNYTVACTATDGDMWQTATKQIEVVEPKLTIKIAPWYPKENHYVFFCEAQGFIPTAYDWEFQDGEKLYDQTTGDVYHIFRKNGDFQVTCAASDDERYLTATIDVTIDSCKEYNLTITAAQRTDSGVAVSGILTADYQVSGESITVNDIQTGVLLGEWSAIVNDTETITATFTNNCGWEYTAQSTVDQDIQTSTIKVNQPINLKNSDGANSCWPGFHKQDGKCVQDSEPILAIQEQHEPQEIPPQENPEMPVIEKQQYTVDNFEPFTQEVPKSLSWLILAIGLMVLAAGLLIR